MKEASLKGSEQSQFSLAFSNQLGWLHLRSPKVQWLSRHKDVNIQIQPLIASVDNKMGKQQTLKINSGYSLRKDTEKQQSVSNWVMCAAYRQEDVC